MCNLVPGAAARRASCSCSTACRRQGRDARRPCRKPLAQSRATAPAPAPPTAPRLRKSSRLSARGTCILRSHHCAAGPRPCGEAERSRSNAELIVTLGSNTQWPLSSVTQWRTSAVTRPEPTPSMRLQCFYTPAAHTCAGLGSRLPASLRAHGVVRCTSGAVSVHPGTGKVVIVPLHCGKKSVTKGFYGILHCALATCHRPGRLPPRQPFPPWRGAQRRSSRHSG